MVAYNDKRSSQNLVDHTRKRRSGPDEISVNTLKATPCAVK